MSGRPTRRQPLRDLGFVSSSEDEVSDEEGVASDAGDFGGAPHRPRNTARTGPATQAQRQQQIGQRPSSPQLQMLDGESLEAHMQAEDEADARRLAADTTALRDMSADAMELLAAQGEALAQADEALEDGVEHTKEAVKEITKARRHQKKAMWLVKALPPGLAGAGGIALAAGAAAMMALGPIGIAGAALVGAGVGIGAGVGGVKIAEDVRKKQEAVLAAGDAARATIIDWRRRVRLSVSCALVDEAESANSSIPAVRETVVAGEEFSVRVANLPTGLFRPGSYIDLCTSGEERRVFRVRVPESLGGVRISTLGDGDGGGVAVVSFTLMFPKRFQIFGTLSEGSWVLRYWYVDQFKKRYLVKRHSFRALSLQYLWALVRPPAEPTSVNEVNRALSTLSRELVFGRLDVLRHTNKWEPSLYCCVTTASFEYRIQDPILQPKPIVILSQDMKSLKLIRDEDSGVLVIAITGGDDTVHYLRYSTSPGVECIIRHSKSLFGARGAGSSGGGSSAYVVDEDYEDDDDVCTHVQLSDSDISDGEEDRVGLKDETADAVDRAGDGVTEPLLQRPNRRLQLARAGCNAGSKENGLRTWLLALAKCGSRPQPLEERGRVAYSYLDDVVDSLTMTAKKIFRRPSTLTAKAPTYSFEGE